MAASLPTGSCIALVVAAGRGLRAGGEIPKQYQEIGGEPLIRIAINNLLQHPDVQAVCPVISSGDEALFAAATEGLTVLPPVPGGDTRQESVLCGLKAIADLSPRMVLIHDAARPFVSQTLISDVIQALEQHDGAVPGLRVVDTLKRANSVDCIAETVPREGLWRAQTPQGFRFLSLMDAYERIDGAPQMTDDASIAEAAGLSVALVDGDEANFKITTESDFQRANQLLCTREIRTGTGFDVHRFSDGTDVQLCGVTIAYDRTLEGHSDADVGMHALCDAIYGAIGAGDIGVHFPPSEEKWRGAPSQVFLAHAASLVRERLGRIVNVDVTLVCQAPAISPHRDAMRQTLAEILKTDVSRVSVKATTTERLGFTGREEGIAAQALATVSLPAIDQN